MDDQLTFNQLIEFTGRAGDRKGGSVYPVKVRARVRARARARVRARARARARVSRARARVRHLLHDEVVVLEPEGHEVAPLDSRMRARHRDHLGSG